MPLAPDPLSAAELLARLDALRAVVAAAEDDVLAALVVTGEPQAQRVLDDWLDQVADTLRALGETADRLAPGVARHATGSTGAVASPEPEGVMRPTVPPAETGAATAPGPDGVTHSTVPPAGTAGDPDWRPSTRSRP